MEAKLDAYWMPFTANRQFKANPRMLESAEGMYYVTPDGRRVLDATSGLWCCNAGHGRKEITDAIARQAAEMDYAPSYQMGHPIAFELAERLATLTPGLITQYALRLGKTKRPLFWLSLWRSEKSANGASQNGNGRIFLRFLRKKAPNGVSSQGSFCGLRLQNPKIPGLSTVA